MVATLIMDSFHFNSATYKEYSEKVKSVDQTQKSNDILLKQNDLQQKQIIELQTD